MSRAVVFAYHNVGVRCLSVLLAHGVDVALVVTHEDSPNETIWFDSVADLASRHGIPVIIPADPNVPQVVHQIAALRPDFLFSFYYRQMLKPALLAIATRGAWNMHGSLLPRYRGRVPVNWAIIHGERETGATLHAMVEKPDAGGIVVQQAVPILPDDTAFEVFNKVTLAAEMALDRVLPDLLAGRAVAQVQDLAAGSYFGGRKAEDGRIDWTRPAQDIHNLIRAVAPPYPGAFCDLPRGRLRVLRSLHPTDEKGRFGRPTLFEREGQLLAECGDGRLLRLVAVEFAGSPLLPGQLEKSTGSTSLALP
jgi:methionyl-tRNA formyltransferase